ncbi:MAG: hypothetical protein H0T65_22240, partial [Deltaproteobacteria bacterium]|nr:hypothetical protein [Deltaproteobacteria bacterium]
LDPEIKEDNKVLVEKPKEVEKPPVKTELKAQDKADAKKKLRVTGFVQGLYSYARGREPAGAFSITRARIRGSAEIVPDRFSVTAMMELASLPTMELRDAYGTIRVGTQEIRLGQFKPAFGWENALAARYQPTVERSLLSRPISATAPGRLRDIGVGVFGEIPISKDVTIEDSISVFNGAGDNTPEDTPRKDVMGRLGIAYRKIVRIGVSGSSVQFERVDAMDPSIATRETSIRYGADVVVDQPYFMVVAEVAEARFSEPDDRKRRGAYGMALGKLPFGVRPVVRYEILNPSTKETGDTRKRVYVGVNHHLVPDNLDAFWWTVAYIHDFAPTSTHLVLVRAHHGF